MVTTDEKIISLGVLSYNNDKMKEYVQDEIDKIPSSAVDDTLSDTSEHPVQNKVVTVALNSKADQTTVDSALSLKANSADVTASLAGKSDTGHTHDDRYYTESETNALLDDKVEVSVFDSHANNTTVHVTAEEKAVWDSKAELTDIPTTLPANGGNADTVNGLTVQTAVPANAVFTDTKVTAVGNHYTPSGGSTTSASGGTLTDITNSSAGVQVVTGVTKDAAGHVTGVTSVALKSTNTNTTYSNFVKSGSGAKAGLVPAPSTTAGTTKYLREDGSWQVPPNTTYSNMTAATANAAGKAGLVPAPAAGKQTSFLRGDGTWVVPTNTTYGNASTSAAGLVSTGAQTFAGNKTFNGQVIPAGASAVGTAQARKIYAGTSDMTAGTTALETGAIYLVYE